MDNLSSAYNNFGLTISTKKTKDKVPDTEVLKLADIPSAIAIMRKAQLGFGRPCLPYARQLHSKAAPLRGNSAVASAQLEDRENTSRTV
ncbi:hypothetical protein ACOMHN_003255 [Nucella lapillus]